MYTTSIYGNLQPLTSPSETRPPRLAGVRARVCAPTQAFPLYSWTMTSTRARRYGRANTCRARNHSITVAKRSVPAPSPSPARGRRPCRPDHPQRSTETAEHARRGPAPPTAASGTAAAPRTTAGEPVRGVGMEEVRYVPALSGRHGERCMRCIYAMDPRPTGESDARRRGSPAPGVRWVSLAGGSSAFMVPSRARAPRKRR